jgi:steroid delta-isomerase-like uncharacterized protein
MDHTATLRRMYDLINAHDIDAFGELLADDFVEHEELPAGGPTREGVKSFFRMQIAAFPDFAMTLADVVDGGDKVVARARFTGTHKGEFMGLPPTGRAVDVQLVDIMRFADDGLVHEHWGVFDAMAMMRQLGASAG